MAVSYNTIGSVMAIIKTRIIFALKCKIMQTSSCSYVFLMLVYYITQVSWLHDKLPVIDHLIDPPDLHSIHKSKA